VAEIRFEAEVAGWGDRRRGVLQTLIQRSAVIPPLGEVITDESGDLFGRHVNKAARVANLASGRANSRQR